MEVIFILLGIAIIIVYVWIALQFAEVAIKKGYETEGKWKALSILIGGLIWLLIIALPNRIQHAELLAAIRESKRAENITTVDIDELPDL